MLVLGFSEDRAQAEAVAAALGAPFALVDVHHFPDGESKLRLPERVPAKVVVCRTLDRPNAKLVELLLAAEGARALGAEELTLVAPYLCYMRQDKAFEPGEVVSQKIVGRFLAEHFHTVITVDPHLHRVSTLAEAVPAKRAIALSAAPAMGRFLAQQDRKPLVVGPDRESEQWVRTVAEVAGLDYVVASKVRRGDRSVAVTLPERDYTGVEAVLVDDLASTGRTLAGATEALKSAGAAKIDVLVTHAMFVGDALETLKAAGAGKIWSSDSLPHPTNAFALANEMAAAIA